MLCNQFEGSTFEESVAESVGGFSAECNQLEGSTSENPVQVIDH